MIYVIDYGMGNLRSVTKAIEKLGGKVQLTSQPEDVKRADKLVLPGVGAFGDGCDELQRRRLFTPLREALRQDRPFLGICLGMQLLFEESEESPKAKGLGVFRGKVRRFQSPDVKIPHMGWNQMRIKNRDAPILKGILDGSYFYFVHSYYPVPDEASLVAGTCQYGREEFAAFLGRGAVWASQFHPEKSQEAGLRILQNFIAL